MAEDAVAPWDPYAERYDVTLSNDGVWSWFSDARAVHHEALFDRTFVGWVNHEGDIQVGTVDHEDRTLMVATLHQALQADDHANPALLVRADGRLVAFYSAHYGTDLFLRVSAAPEDGANWGPELRLGVNTSGPGGYTYANPVSLPAEGDRVYLFWRGANDQPSFATSNDGEHFSAARTLFEVPNERPYVKVASDGVGRIHFALTDGHPREVTANSIYHFFYEQGAFFRVDGASIGDIGALPVRPPQADLVYDASRGGASAWVWDIALDTSGHPVIVYVVLPSEHDHRYQYARWTGMVWETHEIVAAGGTIDGPAEPYYSGGIALDHENPGMLYLARETDGVHELERWTTEDGGATWSSEALTSGSDATNARPAAVRGGRCGLVGLFWWSGRYAGYTDYDTAVRGAFFPSHGD